MGTITPKISDTLKLLDKIGNFSKEKLANTFAMTLGLRYGVNKEAIDEVVELYTSNEDYLDHTIEIAKIYGKHFTHKEIKGILKFYESPIGKKALTKGPQIAEDTYQAGLNLAKKTQGEITPKIVEILQRHGVSA